jgi:hypothetical protein
VSTGWDADVTEAILLCSPVCTFRRRCRFVAINGNVAGCYNTKWKVVVGESVEVSVLLFPKEQGKMFGTAIIRCIRQLACCIRHVKE